eukprot:scaffold2469_cov239-Pinguiococcus_pyrenoidosus.AAC.4
MAAPVSQPSRGPTKSDQGHRHPMPSRLSDLGDGSNCLTPPIPSAQPPGLVPVSNCRVPDPNPSSGPNPGLARQGSRKNKGRKRKTILSLRAAQPHSLTHSLTHPPTASH